MDDNVLDREWTAGALICFALPTVVMMVFMGLYTVVDTIFVAQLVSTDALSAINIVCPVVNLTVGLGTMLAAGGNAIVSRRMGEGRYQEAREAFTLLILTGAAAGVLLLLAGRAWMDPIIAALGASGPLFPYCRDYLSVLLWFIPANLLQTLFSNLFVTAGRPGLGSGLSVLAGLTNIVLDYVLIVPCGLGIRGAALGTGFGCLVPAAAGLIFFAGRRGPLFFTRPVPDWRVLGESCFNGSSELVGQLAAAVTTFLFNVTMLDLLGEDGVAAITIAIYSQFLLNTAYIGFSMGIAPIVGFHFGAGNRARLRQVVSTGVRVTAAASAAVFALARGAGPGIVGLFAREGSEVYSIAAEGFALFSYSFLFCGLNIFVSALFTALSNGRVSAALSFLRTFGLLAGGLLLLPRVLGPAGVWLAAPAAEGVMSVVSGACLLRCRARYGY